MSATTAVAPLAPVAPLTPVAHSTPFAPHESDLVITIETHGDRAMMYLSGRLGQLAALHAARACEDIPRSVSALRVDLRRVYVTADGALETLALALGAWRAGRDVHMRFDLPTAGIAA